MNLTYNEIKEDVKDSFESLFIRVGYCIEDAFYSTIEDYLMHQSSNIAEECCLYLNFALFLLEKKEDIEFMKLRLIELLNEENFEFYEIELNEEYNLFLDDLSKLKKFININ